MNRKLYYFILFATLLLSVSLAHGQIVKQDTGKTTKKDTNSKIAKHGNIKFGVTYINNNVFMGRSDTVRTPTIIPNVKYTLKNGIYFSGSLYYIPNRKTKKVDGGDIAGGYDFDITDDLSGAVSYTKLFYNANSTQIGSSITSTFNGALTYDIGEIITPSISVDYNINRQSFGNDVFVDFGLTHDFAAEGIFGKKDIFIVSPTVALNTGTQNFFDAYLTNKKFKNAKKTAAETALITAQQTYLNAYRVLDYEFSAPVEYKSGPFIFTFIPTYSVAENKLPASVSSKLSTETGLFYFQLGVAFKF